MTARGINLFSGGARILTADEHGAVLTRTSHPLPPGGAAALVHDLLRDAGGTATGVALSWPHGDLPAGVTAALGAAVPAPVSLGAGAASALAEAWCGAARGVRNLIAFQIDTHLTAGILVDGVVLRGAHGEAGAVEWLALNPVERADYRKHGGLGAEVSPAGIVRRVVGRVKAGDASVVADAVAGDFTRITANQIFAAAEGGDGVAVSVVRDTARYVAMALANMVAVLDPEVVVLGGLLAGPGAPMLGAIRSEFDRRLRPAQAGRTAIVLSTLGADAAALGAAWAASQPRS